MNTVPPNRRWAMKKPPRLADTICTKLDAGRLPREDHIKLWIGYGQNRPCAVCERVILCSQVQHELQFADGRIVSMHLGCADLYQAERRRLAGLDSDHERTLHVGLRPRPGSARRKPRR